MIRSTIAILAAAGLLAVIAAPAHAEGQSARDIQAAVDSYLASSDQEANLVGGVGTAGYDNGFWIRGGDFLLRINLTLQARFEAWDWDVEDQAGNFFNPFAGDTSGFSLPRATLKFSGEAPCSMRYYMELEFGHFGRDVVEASARDDSPFATTPFLTGPEFGPQGFNSFGIYRQSQNFDNTREAWIEWAYCPEFNFRMGQIMTPNTRQLMTAPENQQFVDISLASSFVGQHMPGYTDRNRDHGFMIHGAFGCNGEFSYMAAVTNGDGGDSIRNVLDHRTSDNLAYSARLNWAFLNPIGYEEGALRQQTCEWYGELGGFFYYYADRVDKPHGTVRDLTVWGVDLALGYGGFSMTAAYSGGQEDDIFGGGLKNDWTAWLAQIGYHFPGTAWEIAARVDSYDNTPETGGVLSNINPYGSGSVLEFAFAVNYYLNGHGNKLTLDVSFVQGQDPLSVIKWDAYPGYSGGVVGEQDAILFRFQWQLAL